MTTSKAEPKFYEPEYIAVEVKNIISDRYSHLRLLDGFYNLYQDDSYYDEDDSEETDELLDYEVTTASFIEFVAERIIREKTFEAETVSGDATFSEEGEYFNDLSLLPIEEAFRFYGVEHDSFWEYLKNKDEGLLSGYDDDDIYEYLIDLKESGESDNLYNAISRDVFLVLDKNGSTIPAIEEMIADKITGQKNRRKNGELDPNQQTLF